MKRRARGCIFATALCCTICAGQMLSAQVPSTTTLAVTPASPVASGTVITLTAAVTENAVPVTTGGLVIFCNAAAAFCDDATAILGTAQLTPTGIATLRLVPGIGTHSYKAVFEPHINTGSMSAAQSLTVTGSFPTTTTIAATGVAGNYTLTANVAGLGSNTLSPTGTVSFLDTTTGNSPLGTGTLGAAMLAQTFVQAKGSPITVGPGSATVVAGDFNGDGKIDLATVSRPNSAVSVLLGNGDGTFQPPVTYPAGAGSTGAAAGDFNGDGKLDLVTVNASNPVGFSILLGNGDGTFQPPVTSTLAGNIVTGGISVGDLNGDGKADLVTTNLNPVSPNGSGTVSILLGNGDGTFQTQVQYGVGGNPGTAALGDLRGNGRLDLVVANQGSNTVSVLLGNGDGTFQPQVTYAVGKGPSSAAVGDFRGTGVIDLAVVNATDGTVSVLLGNGDGTFQPQTTYAVGTNPVQITAGDLNGDGKTDLIVSNHTSDTVSVLLGNGDGTFQPQITYPDGGLAPNTDPLGLVVGDLNGDGNADIVTTNGSFVNGTGNTPTTVTVLLNQITQTAMATLSGVSVTGGGTHNVDASYPGDSNLNFAASLSGTVPLASGLAQTIRFPGIPNHTLGDAPFTLNALASSQLPVTYTVVSGLAAITGNTVTLAGAGSVTIQADQAGNAVFAAATPVQQTFTVTGPTLTLVFTGPGTVTSGQQPIVTFQLVNPYPVPLTGTITLAFQPDPKAGVDDPTVQFATGGRSLAFTIPANITVTPTVQIQTGTVAGNAVLTLQVLAGGVDVTPAGLVPVLIIIPAAVPNLNSVTKTVTGDAITVTVQGFSNTREVTKATFHFAGEKFKNPDVTVDVTGLFAAWYASAASQQFGSTFRYTQNFTLSSSAAKVTSITVTLDNSIGTSTTGSAQ